MECPELRSLLGMGGCLILESHSRIRGGGVGRGWAGGGAGKRTIRAAAQAGGSQAGHGGCPRGAATGSRRRPRAPGPPGLLGLRCAGHGPESPGGRLQPSPAGAGAGDHPAARCHHARLWLPMPLPGEHAPALSGKGGGGVCGPQPRRAGLFGLGLTLLLLPQFLRSQAPPCTAHLRDPGFTALLVTGFLLLVPLLVLALASYRRLCLRLRLADCLVPYSRALYRRRRNPQPRPARSSPGPQVAPTSGKVWV